MVIHMRHYVAPFSLDNVAKLCYKKGVKMEAFLLSEEHHSSFAPLRTVLQPHRAIDSKVDPDWSQAKAIPAGVDDHMCRAPFHGDADKLLPSTVAWLKQKRKNINASREVRAAMGSDVDVTPEPEWFDAEGNLIYDKDKPSLG